MLTPHDLTPPSQLMWHNKIWVLEWNLREDWTQWKNGRIKSRILGKMNENGCMVDWVSNLGFFLLLSQESQFSQNWWLSATQNLDPLFSFQVLNSFPPRLIILQQFHGMIEWLDDNVNLVVSTHGFPRWHLVSSDWLAYGFCFPSWPCENHAPFILLPYKVSLGFYDLFSSYLQFSMSC